ncbi:MAG TPA: transposase family protein [Micromonospora sp.]|nr:transposase family protein [Micromonospora sp.]
MPVVDVPVADVCRDLLELLAGVSDGRSSQGRDHPVAVVLALAAAATVAGMKGYTAIDGWVADVPTAVLADLHLRAGALPVGRPSRSTIWRACTDADAEALDTVIGMWLANNLTAYIAAEQAGGEGAGGPDCTASRLLQVRLDGKTVRGAKDADGDQLHLLAALASPADDPAAAVVVAQAEVTGAKTNEPEAARNLLQQIDLNDMTVTAAALHTVKATAELIHQRAGHFVLPVKENRRAPAVA